MNTGMLYLLWKMSITGTLSHPSIGTPIEIPFSLLIWLVIERQIEKILYLSNNLSKTLNIYENNSSLFSPTESVVYFSLILYEKSVSTIVMSSLLMFIPTTKLSESLITKILG